MQRMGYSATHNSGEVGLILVLLDGNSSTSGDHVFCYLVEIVYFVIRIVVILVKNQGNILLMSKVNTLAQKEILFLKKIKSQINIMMNLMKNGLRKIITLHLY